MLILIGSGTSVILDVASYELDGNSCGSLSLGFTF